MKINSRKFLKESLIIIAMCINYTFAFLFTVVFNSYVPVFIIVATAFSFLAGILIQDLTKAIAYVGISLIMGGVITVFLLMAPALSYGETWGINDVFESAVQSVVKLFILTIVFSFIGTLLGIFASDSF